MIDSKINKMLEDIGRKFPMEAESIREYITGNYGIFFERRNMHRTVAVGYPLSAGCSADVYIPSGKDGSISAAEADILSVGDSTAVVRTADGNVMDVPLHDISPVISSDDCKISFRLSDSIHKSDGGVTHALIAGENYYALKELSRRYTGRVDCIYIDPPFNTGATTWKYNNKYSGSGDAYPHSAWLSFMEERLLIAKELLNPECSVLIAVIDEKENIRLGMLLERIFSDARIQMVSVCTNMAGSTRKNMFSRTDETYFFVMIGDARPERLPLSDEWMTGNKSVLLNRKLVWESFKRRTGISYRVNAPSQFYPIFVTKDLKHFHSIGESLPPDADRFSIVPPDGTVAAFPIRSDGSEGIWQMSPDSARELLSKGYIRLGKANKQSAVSITYLKKGQRDKLKDGIFNIVGHREDGSVIENENNDYVVPRTCGTQWRISSHNASVYGTPLVNALVGVNSFQFPKSLYAVHDAMRFFVKNKKDALVVDFFAGSATTMHAVSLLNSADGGQRRCICITNNEVGKKESAVMMSEGVRPHDDKWIQRGVAHSIAWKRISNYINGTDAKGRPLNGTYIGGMLMSDGFNENVELYDMIFGGHCEEERPHFAKE